MEVKVHVVVPVPQVEAPPPMKDPPAMPLLTPMQSMVPAWLINGAANNETAITKAAIATRAEIFLLISLSLLFVGFCPVKGRDSITSNDPCQTLLTGHTPWLEKLSLLTSN